MDTVTPTPSPAMVAAPNLPSVFIHPSAHPLLTGKVQATLSHLLDLLAGEARAQGVRVSKTEVCGFVDPEEDTDSVVVMQWVEVSPQRALAYWDHLGAAMETWTDQLPRKDAAIMAERIAVEVRWEADARAA